ncbi:hypothetical protein BSK59_05495 [Paenibacillus odorifer]|uniref:HNH endonuclease n=1 Tax=Paenibacillus odorifer TaxID=189426 RepID=UPI00096C8041|nr:HNH endonuclease [Paenibacillus odorifer]OME60872.1 hypothetical protein BSK59_05495 [Paenibacillus odorifer]
MPMFSPELRKIYSATTGAYSQVTHREATGDKSVTLDTNEKNVFYSVYDHSSIARKGGVGIFNGVSGYKSFIVHDANDVTSEKSLSIVFPKSVGNELRLYFRSGEFYPQDGDYWFIFAREGEKLLHIGWMNPNDWQQRLNLKQREDEITLRYKSQENIDDEDAEYQKQIGAASVKLPTTSSVLKYDRNPTVALRALKAAGYTCEADSSHETFISVTGKPYVECHHLIPVSLLSRFPSAHLDVEENIVALCPLCHRHVHYGTGERKRELLDKLWMARKEDLARRQINVSYEEFLKIYME